MDTHFYCDKCGKNFKFSYNLNVHLKKVHGISKTNGIDSGLHTCNVCKKSFSSKYNLKVHKESIHHLLEEKPFKRFTCNQCDSQFSWQKDLKAHFKTKHSNTPNPRPNESTSAVVQTPLVLECLLCEPGQFKVSEKVKLEKHFEQEHGIQNECVTLSFKTFDEFKNWKDEEEVKTSSKFVVERGPRNVQEEGILTYACHRSGFYRPKGNGLRHLKTQGSCKINSFCPAKLRLVKTVTDTFVVKYYKTHVGHEKSLGHIQLTIAEREMLANQIASKKPFDDILDDVRNSIGQHDGCTNQRLYFLTRKDLHNIEKEFSLNNDGVFHKDDATSVQCWVDSVKDSEDNCIQFYKAQGVSPDPTKMFELDLPLEDFCLIIMSDVQKDMLLKFGHNKITVDGTHGIGNYGFQLVTIMVIDDLNQGFPVAFMVSNKVNYTTIKTFFTVIRANTGQIETSVFMSDMEENFHSAWVNVMGKPHKRLFCTWHVDRAWRKNIQSKVKTTSKKAEVYKYLRMLLVERDENIFNQLVNKFIAFLSNDEDTIEYASYFNDNYLSKRECWAYCYRKGSGINTNMHLERMHKTLKYIYFKGKKIQRLDKALFAIMKLTRDKVVDRLIVLNKGKITTKLTALRQRHKTSQELNPTLVMACDEGWLVPTSSDNEELYLVTHNNLNNSCNCRLVCAECNRCIHNFSCTCIDSEIRGNMCKHIHLVCVYLAKTNVAEEEDLINKPICETNEETSSIIKHLSKQHPAPEELLDNTRRSLSLNKKLFTEKVSELLGSITTEDEMSVMWRLLKRGQIELKAKIPEQNFVKVCKEPSNKKITPQVPPFKRRKGNTRTRGKNFVTPNSKEKSEMEDILMLQDTDTDEEDVFAS